MRLIDADQLLQKLQKDPLFPFVEEYGITRVIEAAPTIVDLVDEQPTVDAVEVVRCKDCKYGEPNGQHGCKCYHYKLYETHEMSPNDFCSRAERRKDETD